MATGGCGEARFGWVIDQPFTRSPTHQQCPNQTVPTTNNFPLGLLPSSSPNRLLTGHRYSLDWCKRKRGPVEKVEVPLFIAGSLKTLKNGATAPHSHNLTHPLTTSSGTHNKKTAKRAASHPIQARTLQPATSLTTNRRGTFLNHGKWWNRCGTTSQFTRWLRFAKHGPTRTALPSQ